MPSAHKEMTLTADNNDDLSTTSSSQIIPSGQVQVNSRPPPPLSFSYPGSNSTPTSSATRVDHDRSSVYTERSIHSLPEGEEERVGPGSLKPSKLERDEVGRVVGSGSLAEGNAVEGMSTVRFPLDQEWDSERDSKGRDMESSIASLSTGNDLEGTVSSSTTIRDLTTAARDSHLRHLEHPSRNEQAQSYIKPSTGQQRMMTAYPRFRVNSMNAVLPISRKWSVEEARSEDDTGKSNPSSGAGLPPVAGAESPPETETNPAPGFPLGTPPTRTLTRLPPGRMRMRIRSIDPALYPRMGSQRWGNVTNGSSSSGCSTPAVPSSPIKSSSGEVVLSPPGSPRKFRVRRSSGYGPSRGSGQVVESEEERARLRERRDKACKTVNEMAESEERFRSGLRVVIDLFLEPLTRIAGTDEEIISTRQIKQIFGNIREIEALSERIEEALDKVIRPSGSDYESQGHVGQQTGAHMKRLGEIKRGQGTLTRSSSAPALFQKAKAKEKAEEDEVPRISSVLLGLLPYLSLYYPFITAFPTIPSTLNELCASNPKFAAFIKMQEEQVRCHRLGLCHWLLTVVQRIPRWTILIENLRKVTDDPMEREALGRAHAMSEKVTENINERLKEQTAILTLVNLQKAFDGLRRPLVAPARKLLKKGVLRQSGGSLNGIWLFLFNDILVCARATGGTSMTANMLSQWIYTAEGSLSAFASSMAKVISHSTTQVRSKGSRPASVVENSFSCTAWIEVEDMTVFALEGERDAAKRERAFQITSPLASMELVAEDHTEKESWLIALNDAKYGRLADLQTIQQTATIRQAKRKSLHAVSRRSSSSAFSTTQDPNYMPIDDLIMAVEADGYNSPVVQEAGRSSGACGQCRAMFTLMKAPQPCLLACGKLFCSDCLTQTFTITGDPTGKLRAACDTCYRSVFRSPAPTEHDVLDAHVNFTLSRHSLDEDQRHRQKSAGGVDDVATMTSTSAMSRTSSRSTGGAALGGSTDSEPSQAVKKLRELLQR